ncbi:hypothetical protein FACS189450_04050 [Spirochaetia bacterium]|nr:hypothetical protein FACS189450_04050 [Spirochaetia bacterium]
MSNVLTLFLRSINKDIVDEWMRVFAGYKNVEISCGDIFDIKADAIISPANSFGFMDGGIDLAYSKYFGWKLQKTLMIYAYDTILDKEPLNFNSLFDAYTIHQVLTGKLK